MTNRVKAKNIIRKIGGIRRLILILVAAVLAVILLLDILVVGRILDPLVYLYVILGTLVVLYGIYPLYANRRLTGYYWERFRKNRLAVAGLAFVLFLILLAFFGPLFTADPTAVNFEEKNRPPKGFVIEESVYNMATQQFATKSITGSSQHLLGTDNKGRDLLAMIVSGTMVSLQVGLFATGIAIVLGTLIGVTSAY